MSYSFSVKVATAALVAAAVAAKFDEIVESQPIHAQDREAAQTAAVSMAGLLKADDTKDVLVSVYGSLSYMPDDSIVGGGLNVSVSQQDKETESG